MKITHYAAPALQSTIGGEYTPSAAELDHVKAPRLCSHYCNALIAGGELGPRCPHCDVCESVMGLAVFSFE